MGCFVGVWIMVHENDSHLRYHTINLCCADTTLWLVSAYYGGGGGVAVVRFLWVHPLHTKSQIDLFLSSSGW